MILRDGRTMRLRPPTRADASGVLAFFGRLSERSRHLRFHGLPQVTRELVEPFLDPDGVERGALVGVLEEGGAEHIVALASWSRLPDSTSAEVAFTVSDALQGKGIGTRLLEQLADLAQAAGIETFVAEVLPENREMLRVFADAGFVVSRESDGGTVEVRFSIEPTEVFLARMDERDRVAVLASLRPFFAPRSVAVVGASAREGSIGGTVFRNVVQGGFEGPAYPVNRSGASVAGRPALRTVSEAPEPVELVVVCVPAPAVLEIVEDALRAGSRALCVISAGFAEIGREGVERQERLLALVRAYGARLLGPNGLGIAVAAARLNATFAREAFPAGPIGFGSQSGALGLALLEAAEARGLGFSAFVSIGNKADVSSNDLLEWWESDPDTRLVLLYLESFGNPRRFGRIARRVARGKPILVLKSGTTRAGARAASSHTAALAGSETAVAALFRQAGVIRAQSLEELLDVAALASAGAVLAGRRVGVLTNAGGLGILCADACEAAGLELPRLSPATEEALARVLPREAGLANPVDMLGTATAATYETALPLLLAEPALDAVVVLFVPAAAVTAEEVAAAVVRAVGAQPGKPVACVVMSAAGIPEPLRAAGRGIAAFPYPESAARALARLAERADWLRRPPGSVPVLSGIDHTGARRLVVGALASTDDGRWLAPEEVRALLSAYGVPLVEERGARSPEDAVAAALELGLPVAVKTAVPGVHKTEIGGVALDLRDEEAVREASARIGPEVVVQPMVEGGIELLAGMVQDPLFGPLVAFGAGGRLAELVGEAGFRIAPLTDTDAAELLDEGRAGTLVRGFRGAPAADRDALVDVLHRLSRLGEDLPEVAELDLNPIIALQTGCVAVDARVRVAAPRRITPTKTW